MRSDLGKLDVTSVREGEGSMPMQFAVPGDIFPTRFYSQLLIDTGEENANRSV